MKFSPKWTHSNQSSLCWISTLFTNWSAFIFKVSGDFTLLSSSSFSSVFGPKSYLEVLFSLIVDCLVNYMVNSSPIGLRSLLLVSVIFIVDLVFTTFIEPGYTFSDWWLKALGDSKVSSESSKVLKALLKKGLVGKLSGSWLTKLAFLLLDLEFLVWLWKNLKKTSLRASTSSMPLESLSFFFLG